MARNQKSNVILMKAGAMRSAGDGNPRLFTFVGGTAGPWSVMEVRAVVGDSLPMTQRLDVVSGAIPTLPPEADWALSGVTSNVRYVTAAEERLSELNRSTPGVARRCAPRSSRSKQARGGGTSRRMHAGESSRTAPATWQRD